MKPLVLDCSVSMSWCFEDETTPYTEAVLDAVAEHGAVVPSLWPLEVANVVLVAERRGRLTRMKADQFICRLETLGVEVDDATSRRAWGSILSLARTYRLSSYDAAYLELAIREALPLATQDAGLRGVAIKCGVEIFAV